MRVIIIYNIKKRKVGVLLNALEEVVQGIAEVRTDYIYFFADIVIPNRPWTDWAD